MQNLLKTIKDIWEALLFPFICFGGPMLLTLFLAWGVLDSTYLIISRGKIKRGIKIGEKPLKEEYLIYLRSLEKDFREIKFIHFHITNTGFIRTTQNEAVIYSRPPGWGTLLPYVGYVDFSNKENVLEFRSSLPMHLILFPFVLTGVGTILLFFNHRKGTEAIENFLEKKSKEKA